MENPSLEPMENTPETPEQAENAPARTESPETESQPVAAETDASEDAAASGQTPKKPSRWKKELREWIVALAVALAAVFIIRTFLFMFIRVDGNSMNDTLHDGEFLFVTVADMKLFGPGRGDVVICRYPNRGSTHFVKRVVAVPGDQVERVCGVTYVIYADENGGTVREALDERRASRYPDGSPDDYEPYTLGEDEYFVVGDNRYDSHDSRDWNDSDPSRDVGPVTEDMLVGRVRRVLWPPERFGADMDLHK